MSRYDKDEPGFIVDNLPWEDAPLPDTTPNPDEMRAMAAQILFESARITKKLRALADRLDTLIERASAGEK